MKYYPFSLFVMFFQLLYLTRESFFFRCIWLLVCAHAFSSYLWVEFSFFILECFVLFVLLDPVSVSFKSPFFWLYYQTFLLFWFGLFIPTYPRMFFLFLTIFFCFRNFFICSSCLISYQVLYFCSDSFRQHRYYHRLVSLLYKLARLVQ